MVTLPDPLKKACRLEPLASAGPCTRCPTYILPIARGLVPNVLSSRMRTASPGIVTRATMRTVALVIVVMPGPCCELPQAVIHVADEGRCSPSATIPEPRSSATTAAIPVVLDFISSALRQSPGHAWVAQIISAG